MDHLSRYRVSLEIACFFNHLIRGNGNKNQLIPMKSLLVNVDKTGSFWWLMKLMICIYYIHIWLVVSTHVKNISQLGSFPQVGMKTRNIWKHHLVRVLTHPHGPISLQQKSLTCGKLEDPASGPEGTSTHPRAQIKLQGGVPFLFSLFRLGHICCKNSCAAPATAISPGQRPDTPLGS